jgi:hypothetical protein
MVDGMVLDVPQVEEKMGQGESKHVREVAARVYFSDSKPDMTMSFSLGDIQRVLLKEGFPSNHIRQIRTSLESELFWVPLGRQLVSPKGQPDRVSTVLVFSPVREGKRSAMDAGQVKHLSEDPLMRLRGVLKGAMREGAAAFLQELRRDRENEQHEEGKTVA